jgi:VanZ family protein
VALVSAAAFALAFAASDEYHQSFVFGRAGKVSDVAIDLVGILAAVAIISYQRQSDQE